MSMAAFAPIEDYDIIQNEAVGAVCLWAFCLEYHDGTFKARGPALPLVMSVLPIVLHRPSVEALSTRVMAGGLYRGLDFDRTLRVGVQQRMEDLAGKTFSSLTLGAAAGLLQYDPDRAEVLPARRTLPEALPTDAIRPQIATAKRLGNWSAQVGVEQLSALLNIRF